VRGCPRRTGAPQGLRGKCRVNRPRSRHCDRKCCGGKPLGFGPGRAAAALAGSPRRSVSQETCPGGFRNCSSRLRVVRRLAPEGPARSPFTPAKGVHGGSDAGATPQSPRFPDGSGLFLSFRLARRAARVFAPGPRGCGGCGRRGRGRRIRRCGNRRPRGATARPARRGAAAARRCGGNRRGGQAAARRALGRAKRRGSGDWPRGD